MAKRSEQQHRCAGPDRPQSGRTHQRWSTKHWTASSGGASPTGQGEAVQRSNTATPSTTSDCARLSPIA